MSMQSRRVFGRAARLAGTALLIPILSAAQAPQPVPAPQPARPPQPAPTPPPTQTTQAPRPLQPTVARPAPLPRPAQPAQAAQPGQAPAPPSSDALRPYPQTTQPLTSEPAPQVGRQRSLTWRPLQGLPSPLAVTGAATAFRSVSVVLVVGEPSGSGGSDDVPAAARKALDDLKSFLAFKSYRLVDAAIIGAPSQTQASTLRLKGLDPQLFELSLGRGTGTPASSLDVALRELGSSKSASAVMSANVQMAAGETVVVGTSRIGGDRALILIVSALQDAPGGRPSPARER